MNHNFVGGRLRRRGGLNAEMYKGGGSKRGDEERGNTPKMKWKKNGLVFKNKK